MKDEKKIEIINDLNSTNDENDRVEILFDEFTRQLKPNDILSKDNIELFETSIGDGYDVDHAINLMLVNSVDLFILELFDHKLNEIKKIFKNAETPNLIETMISVKQYNHAFDVLFKYYSKLIKNNSKIKKIVKSFKN